MEVDAGALRGNLRTFRSLLPAEARLQVVVKSNAYGHGLEAVARIALEENVDGFGVHTIEEAERLRAAGIDRPILILGYLAGRQAERAVAAEVDVTVYATATLEALSAAARQAGRRARCHVKIETGANRQGVLAHDLDSFVDRALSLPGIDVVGVSTHFANIEDTTDRSYALEQLRLFGELAARVLERAPAALRHCACSAATLTMPETSFDMVRVGIGMYGIWPSRETLVSSRMRSGRDVTLRPVLAWKAKIAQTKWIDSGAFVGYGCTFRATRRTKLGVIPVGYADGYDRRLSGMGHVLLRGRRAPILGRICMNLFMIDATDIEDVGSEDEVVLIGKQGGETITASDVASRCNTIPYEIVARISPSLPRIVVEPADSNGD